MVYIAFSEENEIKLFSTMICFLNFYSCILYFFTSIIGNKTSSWFTWKIYSRYCFLREISRI